MPAIKAAQTALVTRILEGPGEAPVVQRQAAFNNLGLTEPLATLVGKVSDRAYTVTTADFAAAEAAGLTEDQLFELVVCAAVGQAIRQHQAALAALDAVTAKG